MSVNCWCGMLSLQVSHAGVNRLDLLQAAGMYPPPPGDSDVLGVEGTVNPVSPLQSVSKSMVMADE